MKMSSAPDSLKKLSDIHPREETDQQRRERIAHEQRKEHARRGDELREIVYGG